MVDTPAKRLDRWAKSLRAMPMTPANRLFWRTAFLFFVFYGVVQVVRGRYIGAVIELGFVSLATVYLTRDWRAKRA
jgi:hypothetical protein